MVAVPAVLVLLKVSVPVTALVIWALLAEAKSWKFMTAWLLIVAVPAVLLSLNSTSPLLLTVALPAVLLAVNEMAPLLL